jgi:hypothetical protein
MYIKPSLTAFMFNGGSDIKNISPPTYDETKSTVPPTLSPSALNREDEKAITPKSFTWKDVVSSMEIKTPRHMGDEKKFAGNLKVYHLLCKLLSSLSEKDIIWTRSHLRDLVEMKNYFYGESLSTLVKIRDLSLQNYANPEASNMFGPINDALFLLL